MVIGEPVYSKSTRRHCAKQLHRHFCSVSMNVQSIRLRQSLPTTSRTSVPPWNVQYTVPSLVGILLGRRPSHNELNALPQRQLLWAGVKNIYIQREMMSGPLHLRQAAASARSSGSGPGSSGSSGSEARWASESHPAKAPPKPGRRGDGHRSGAGGWGFRVPMEFPDWTVRVI